MTLFPEMIMQGVSTSVTGRGMARGAISVEAVNIRDYTNEKHGHVDDAPYGGGAGMVMQAQPICDCYRALEKRILEGQQAEGREQKTPRVLYMTPQGRVFDQKLAEELAKEEDLILLCGHYEGVDERALEILQTENVSIDFGEGDMIVVVAGAWKDTVGVVQKIDYSKQTATINVELFGRETPVEISFAEVRKSQ